ncbi:MAG TPA: prepilin-type N-terminal cleavage/methylation domain-containing protein [Longimicrobiales bacterium]|nr:prepilin-type N-terminal cleavage/methylation domain-containing protein [Longimicrobiales bacterium]
MTGRAGLTLLELLVALAIMGAALAGGRAAFAGVADHRERAVRRMDEAAREALVRRAITEWLRGARVAGRDGPAFQGLDGVNGDDPDDELSFLTTSSPLADGGDALVRLHIDRDVATPERGLVAVVATWPRAPLDPVERVELAPGAAGLHLRYLSSLGDRRWLPGWVSATNLPLGIELTITAADPDSIAPLLRLPILAAIGAAR